MMELYSLFLVALALSLDAFGVSLCIGLNNAVRRKNKMAFIFSFGFFQFLFSLIGACLGYLFNSYIVSVPQVIGGTLISIVGVLMIKEGFENKGACPLINPKMVVVLGVSVSIDAMVIGFTVFNHFVGSTWMLLHNTLFVGVVTWVMSSIAFFIARHLKRIEIIGKYADYLGGVILVLFGIKMMFF